MTNSRDSGAALGADSYGEGVARAETERSLRLGSGVWRPIQYLGNKLRSLSAILSTVDELASEPGCTIADAFSGSSVVSQGLSLQGYRVAAVDTSPAAALLARATLR